MTTHILKTWPEFFSQIISGKKAAEIRKNDRGFKIGDLLRLREFCPKSQRFTGLETSAVVTYMMENFEGLQRGYCVLSIKLIPGTNTTFNVTTAGKKR